MLGGIAGAGVLYVIASGKAGFDLGGFASNGFAEHSTSCVVLCSDQQRQVGRLANSDTSSCPFNSLGKCSLESDGLSYLGSV